MSPDPRRLEHYLATGGSQEVEPRDPVAQLERALFRRELGRTPEPRSSRVDLLESGSIEEYVAALRGSMEHFVRDLEILGAATSAYRRLSGIASAAGVAVAGQVIAECIACYRLVLGRDPDDSGFFHFVEHRDTNGLVPTIDAFLGSDEAGRHFEPGGRPALADVALAVGSGAMSVLAGATADTSLGTLAQVRGTLDHVMARLDAVTHALDGFATLARLRFDSEAGAR